MLAAEADKPPANYAIAATGDFALDLYGRLAKENPGKNLFFSPYSMSSALTMTAEGARGETAAEMGKVLRFPEAARHIGDDAQLIPWNVGLIHSGMAALNERLNAANKAVPKEVREKIAGLREELKQANSRAAELRKEKNRDWKQYNELANTFPEDRHRVEQAADAGRSLRSCTWPTRSGARRRIPSGSRTLTPSTSTTRRAAFSRWTLSGTRMAIESGSTPGLKSRPRTASRT